MNHNLISQLAAGHRASLFAEAERRHQQPRRQRRPWRVFARPGNRYSGAVARQPARSVYPG